MAPSLPFTRRKAGRFWIILACLLCLGSAVGLILNALSGTIIFFMAPSQMLSHPPAESQTIRLGGMVVAGSLHGSHDGDNTPLARFDITDGQAAIKVEYRGILPDLFREGQSVVALGHYTARPAPFFIASEVLAKHDETYMPKDVADALQKSGKWDPRFGPPPDPASWNRMTAPQQPIQAQAQAQAQAQPVNGSAPSATTPQTPSENGASHPEASQPIPATKPAAGKGG